MIATGANVIKPPFANLDLSNIFTLTKMEDGQKLKEIAMRVEIKDVTIIGAGFIGIEVVEAMRNLGKHVRLIQRSSRVFNRLFDARITDLMQEDIYIKLVYEKESKVILGGEIFGKKEQHYVLM